jgi:hypothetical protein
MSAQLMGLVRELKALNARKKAGETLTPDEETRRKELKTYLKAQLEGAAAGDDEASTAAPRPASTAPVASPRPVATTVPAVVAPRPAPAPVVVPSPPRPAAVPVAAPFSASPPSPASPAPAALFSAATAAVQPSPRSPPPSSAGPIPSRPVSPPEVPARPEPPKFVAKKDAYAISGAMSFIEAAMNSEAVAKVDPWGNRKAQASAGDIEDAEARADAAIRATRKRERVTSPDQVEKQLKEVQGGYTPPEQDHLVLEQYYGDYFGEGMSLAPVQETAALKPIDPREIELRRALDVTAAPGGGATTVTVPPGLAFLDDFSALYAKKVLPPPIGEIEDDAPDPSLLIGRRKVTVHMLNGEKKQGTIRALRRGELGFKLDTPGAQEEIAIAQVKAVFVHLQPNASAKPGTGRAVTVTFRDQRSVQGDTDDYAPDMPVFTLVPPAGRGQFEKILINSGAVATVT